MSVTNFVWDQQNYLAETDGGNAVRAVYTHEPQKYGNLVSSRLSVNTHYHHFDAIGATRELTTSSEAITDAWTYDAWGTTLSTTGSTTIALLWIGELGYYTDSDLARCWVRRRSVVPALGIWTSVDPFWPQYEPLPYSYGHSNPLIFVDPSGLIAYICKCECCTEAETTNCTRTERKVLDAPDPKTFARKCDDFCRSLSGYPWVCLQKSASPPFPGPTEMEDWEPMGKVNCVTRKNVEPWFGSWCLCPQTRKSMVRARGTIATAAMNKAGAQVPGGLHKICTGLPPKGKFYGGGGNASSYTVAIVCPGSGVVVYHFGQTNSNAGESIGLYEWGDSCHAAIAGGDDSVTSRCQLEDIIYALDTRMIKIDGFSDRSGVFIGSDGTTWYHSQADTPCSDDKGCS